MKTKNFPFSKSLHFFNNGELHENNTILNWFSASCELKKKKTAEDILVRLVMQNKRWKINEYVRCAKTPIVQIGDSTLEIHPFPVVCPSKPIQFYV